MHALVYTGTQKIDYRKEKDPTPNSDTTTEKNNSEDKKEDKEDKIDNNENTIEAVSFISQPAKNPRYCSNVL